MDLKIGFDEKTQEQIEGLTKAIQDLTIVIRGAGVLEPVQYAPTVDAAPAVEPEKPKRNRQTKPKEEEPPKEPVRAEHDMYMYHPESDCYFTIDKGAVLSEIDGFEYTVELDKDEWIKRSTMAQEQESAQDEEQAVDDVFGEEDTKIDFDALKKLAQKVQMSRAKILQKDMTGPEASNLATKEIRDILASVGVRNFPELAEKPDLWAEVQNEINNLAVK